LTKLTAKKIESLLKAGHQGRVLDGDGLMLQCRGKGKDGQGRASWLLRYTVKGRVRELGLGSIKFVTLAQARQKAAAARLSLADGRDPVDAKHPVKAKPNAAHTFGSSAEAFWQAHRSRWHNVKVCNQWLPFMARHCRPIWDQPIAQINHHHVLALIEPLWVSKYTTAKRIANRVGQICDYAKVKGHRDGDNPARFKGLLQYALPPHNDNTRHHHATPISELPALMERLAALPDTAALAFRLAILTACRVGEVFGATWDEIDLGAQLWTIPATRYKTGKAHQVPLSPQAMEVLAACPRFDRNPYVFPSPTKAGAPLSNMAIIVLLKRMGLKTTAHGTARSTFSDWAHDFTDVSHEIIEECLGHQTGNAVSRAYRRGQALEKRRALLTLWAERIAPQQLVVPLNAAE
jgi:integrase